MNKSYVQLLGSMMVVLAALPSMVMADAKCSKKTLTGTYIYASTGLKGGSIHAEAGQEVFDGKGGILNTYTDATGAQVVTKGSYDVDHLCIGEAMYEDTGDEYEIYTGPSGSEFSWISVSPGTKINGRDVRVSSSLKPHCSLKTLKGTYIYSHIGYRNGTQYIESGQDVFNGKGEHWNTFTDAGGVTVTTNGTYTVGKNCIGQTYYKDTGDSYSIYVDPKGNELRYAAIASGSSNIGVGSMRRVGKEVIK